MELHSKSSSHHLFLIRLQHLELRCLSLAQNLSAVEQSTSCGDNGINRTGHHRIAIAVHCRGGEDTHGIVLVRLEAVATILCEQLA